jgi:hypothetical protein
VLHCPPLGSMSSATIDRRTPSMSVPRICIAVTSSSARAHLQLEAPAIEITGLLFFLVKLTIDRRLPSLSD